MSFPRYPKYKHSGVEWLGDIPEHWNVVQFKQFVDIQNGADHKHIEQAEGFPVFGSGGVFTYASEFLYDGESVLLGRKGTIDKPLHVTGRFWTVDTMYWTKIRSGVCGRFVYYAALVIPFGYYSTSTALPSMTKAAFNSHLLTFPPLSEQSRIAAFLDAETAKIDALIAEQRRLIELLKEKRQTVISQAVTKGLNPNASMKPSGIEWLGDIPESWQVTRLKYLVRKDGTGIQIGPFGGMLKDLSSEPTGFKLYGQQNIISGKFDVGDRWISEDTYRSNPSYQIRSGDLIVTRKGSLGHCRMIPENVSPGWFDSDSICVRAAVSAIDAKFLQLLLHDASYVSMQIDATRRGAILSGINSEVLRNLTIVQPPLAAQAELLTALAQVHDSFGALTAATERAIELLQERRTTVISEAVTGQIDVREFEEVKAS